MTRSLQYILTDFLQLIPRLEFESAVRQHDAKRHARGVSPTRASSSPCSSVSWGTPSRCAKFVEDWLPARGNFVIWGCPRLLLVPPWLYANEHRPWQLQRTVFEQLLAENSRSPIGQPTRDQKEEEVPFQESSAELGCHGDRSLRHHV